MLENRDYMRAPESGPLRFRWSASTILMVALVAVFILQQLNSGFNNHLEFYLGLTPQGLRHGYLWQLITFQFLHAGLWHLLGNMLGLYFFGRYVETVLGVKRFLVAYFAAGVIGGLFQGILMLCFQNHFGSLLFGASAGVSGLFAIFAMIEREATVQLYFVLPIKAMTLLIVMAVASLAFTIFPFPGDHTAHAAHLGGLLAGIAWVRLGWHRDYVVLPWEGWLARLRFRRPTGNQQRKRELVRAAQVRKESWQRSPAAEPSAEELSPEEFMRKQVDPILDKISKHGIHSLTEKERKILETAPKKISRP